MNKTILLSLALLSAAITAASAQNTVADSLEFDKALATTPATMLQGKVSGVRVAPIDGNVNGAVATLIRGVNALRSDSQPLWIIDGVMINSDLNRNKDAFFQYGEKSYTSPLNALASLNEYDIASIEVLKDLSATAIYGTRGANGVIIINTRLPREEATRVNWNSNVGVSMPDRALEGTTNGISHNHFLSISGANGQTKYILSAYLRQTEGLFKANNGTFGGMRASFDTHANSVVWFGMNAAVTMGQMNSVAGTAYFGQPSVTMTLRDPNFFPGNSFKGWSEDYDDNAVDRRFTNNVYVTLNFTPALKLHTSLGIDYDANTRYIWYGNGTSFGYEMNGAASILGTSIFKYNAKSELSWNHFFGSNHKLTAKAAVEAIGEWTKFNTMNGNDFFSHVLRARGLRLASSKAELHKYNHEYGSWGGYANVNYSYRNLAGIEATLRADNTPRYDDAKMTLYKGASAWFDASKAFLPSNGLVSTLRLEAGYGEAGREQYVPYGLYGEYISGSYPVVDSALEMFYEGLNRVRSMETHAGVDLGLASDKVLLHFGYYDKLTSDAFLAYRFGSCAEGEYYWKYSDREDDFSQSSLIANRGVEADLNIKVIDTKSLKWSVNLNGAYNINQMLRVDFADRQGRKVGDGVFANANALGYPVGALYGYKVDETGAYVDATGDGVINEFDKDIIGNPNPKFYGGLGTTLQLGGLTLDVLANGAAGFDILNMNDLLFNEAAPYQISETYVEKGDYLRLSRVSLGYNIPMKKIRWIREFKVSVSALNLLTLSSYSGWNPEVNCFGSTYLSSGIDYGSYPTARSIVAGISLKF